MTNGTVLVASPSAIGRQPEASGSSVPAWPARLAANSRLIGADRVRRGHADRLVEHDPAVHVALLALALLRLAVLLRRWLHGVGAGRSELIRVVDRHHSSSSRFEVALYRRCSQKLLDPFRFVESFVDAEADVRREFQVNAMRDLAAQESLVALERLEHVLDVLAAERHHVDGGEPQVGRSCALPAR